MPDYLAYHKSISEEFLATKNRVRNLIDNQHWGEDGRFKEIILMKHISNHLPNNYSIGTGFFISEDNISSQIDIIIYNNSYPVLFSYDNFVIVDEISVEALIEVKSSINNRNLKDAYTKGTRNGNLIKHNIFNGIFSYENNLSLSSNEISSSIKNILKQDSKINHICFDNDYFCKLFKNNDNYFNNIYYIKHLAYSYFISNLLSSLLQKNCNNYQNNLHRFFFPIEKTKEAHKKFKIKIEI